MSREEVFTKVTGLIADHFELDQANIQGSMDLMADVDADSIDFVELVLEMEDEFDAEISDDEAANLKTVDDIVNYIASK
jgi:acyl carrier protein